MGIAPIRLPVRLADIHLRSAVSRVNVDRTHRHSIKRLYGIARSFSSRRTAVSGNVLSTQAGHGTAVQPNFKNGDSVLSNSKSVIEASQLELAYLKEELASVSINHHRQRQEADVGNEKLVGSLVIDHERHRDDVTAWAQILQFRARLDGFVGIKEVWKGIQLRQLTVPSSGTDAEFIWTTLLRSTISKPLVDESQIHLAKSVLAHAIAAKNRTNPAHAVIYKVLVGGWMHVDIETARAWHDWLVEQGLSPSEALLHVLDDALEACRGNASAIKLFLSFTWSADDNSLYDQIIDRALAKQTVQEVLLWHRALSQLGDAPSRDLYKRKAVQDLFSIDAEQSLPLKKRKRIVRGLVSPPNSSDLPPLTGPVTSQIVEDAHGIKELGVSDNFVARLLATRVVPLEAAIRGIELLGVDHLDGVGARQLASRCDGLADYLQRVSTLHAKGILVHESSVFARMLHKFAVEGEINLFKKLLESDQHPSNFEDLELQETLLLDFVSKGLDVDAQLSHTALLLLGDAGQTAAWNVHLRHGLRQCQWSKVENAFRELQVKSLQLSDETLKTLYKTLSAAFEERPNYHGSDTAEMQLRLLDIAGNTYMYADSIGGIINCATWIDLLKRHGRLQHWEHIEKIVLHLLRQYKNARSDETCDSRESTTPVVPHAFHLHRKFRDRAHPGRWRQSGRYRAVFTEQMLVALFVWGLRSAMTEQATSVKQPDDRTRQTDDSERTWARGLVLLGRLRSEGIKFSERLIRYAFIDRMWILFGPGKSTIRLNQSASRLNKMTLAQYVAEANEVWPGKLLHDVDNAMLREGDVRQEARLQLHVFGEKRRVSLKSLDHFDVAAWVKATSRERETGQPITTTGIHSSTRLDRFRVRYNQGSLAQFRVIRNGSTPSHSSSQPR